MKVAFVPARSGSKRVPNKNIRSLNGKPLVYWSLKAFLDSDCFDKVFFSSDSEEYFQTVSHYISDERLLFHQRSREQAGDSVKIFDYIKNTYREFSANGDLFAMGLPTAPLRTSEHVSEALHLALHHSRPVFSACEYSFPVSFAFRLSESSDSFNSGWEALLPTASPMCTGNTRSQDQAACYHPNGAIYILPEADKLSTMKTFYTGALPYIMNSSSSVDIDNELDFLIAETIMKTHQGR